jgi:hypothetical protein
MPASIRHFGRGALARTPPLRGKPIFVMFRRDLTVSRDKLLSGQAKGTPVHAASFIRKRRIVLDRGLALQPRELSRILIHELFHFVWLRLGNGGRASWEELLKGEFRRRARGELGWSAERVKRSLTPADVERRSRRWRDYCCESFCDSAAHVFGRIHRHPEMTLHTVFRRARRRWLKERCGGFAHV